MQGQLALFEDPPWPRKRSDGLFFALLPDAATSRRIGRFADQFTGERRLTGSRLRDQRLHVSIQFVGKHPRLRPGLVHGARLAGDAISLPPFEVSFRVIESFQGWPSRHGGPQKNPLVLRADGEGLFGLHGALYTAMNRVGLRPGEHFNPHLTLLYGPGVVLPQPIEPIRFVARELVLIHSEHGLTRYNALGRWPLDA